MVEDSKMKNISGETKYRFANDLGILLVLTLITTFLDLYGVQLYIDYENPIFFIGIGFIVVFGIWYGWKGILAAFLGCFFGALISLQMSPEWALVIGLAQGIQVAIPVLVFRVFSLDAALKSAKDISLFFLSGCILNTLINCTIGIYVLFVTENVTSQDYLYYFGVWTGGDMVMIFLISPILLSFGTPYMRAKGWLP